MVSFVIISFIVQSNPSISPIIKAVSVERFQFIQVFDDSIFDFNHSFLSLPSKVTWCKLICSVRMKVIISSPSVVVYVHFIVIGRLLFLRTKSDKIRQNLHSCTAPLLVTKIRTAFRYAVRINEFTFIIHLQIVQNLLPNSKPHYSHHIPNKKDKTHHPIRF
jgi:hypothetical protein